MRVSLRDWARRWKRRAGGRRGKHAKFLTACLSLGLATAWAAPAEATSVHLEVTPTETLKEAWVGYYHLNNSNVNSVFLGTLLGGQTSQFDHDFPGVPLSAFDVNLAYMVVGLYGDEENESVSLSHADDSPVTNNETWESFIKPIHNEDEQDVIDGLLGIHSWSIAAFFNGHKFGLAVPYGTPVTMINYSDAAFGGTAIATVPEPATWVLMVSAAGILAFALRRRR